jgi:hypothetical protein
MFSYRPAPKVSYIDNYNIYGQDRKGILLPEEYEWLMDRAINTKDEVAISTMRRYIEYEKLFEKVQRDYGFYKRDGIEDDDTRNTMRIWIGKRMTFGESIEKYRKMFSFYWTTLKIERMEKFPATFHLSRDERDMYDTKIKDLQRETYEQDDDSVVDAHLQEIETDVIQPLLLEDQSMTNALVLKAPQKRHVQREGNNAHKKRRGIKLPKDVAQEPVTSSLSTLPSPLQSTLQSTSSSPSSSSSSFAPVISTTLIPTVSLPGEQPSVIVAPSITPNVGLEIIPFIIQQVQLQQQLQQQVQQQQLQLQKLTPVRSSPDVTQPPSRIRSLCLSSTVDLYPQEPLAEILTYRRKHGGNPARCEVRYANGAKAILPCSVLGSRQDFKDLWKIYQEVTLPKQREEYRLNPYLYSKPRDFCE